MIYVTGDTHGTHDIEKVRSWYNKNQAILTKDDVLVVLGDWGGLWHPIGSLKYKKLDNHVLVQWAKKKFTTFIIPGNHENYDIIESLPVIEKFGAKCYLFEVKRSFDNKYIGDIYIAVHGEVYTIDDKKILAYGGATSQDKAFRTLGIDYWSQEVPNISYEYSAFDNLKKHDMQVHYVFSHTCPVQVARVMFTPGTPEYNNYHQKSEDYVSKFLQSLIDDGLKFNEWHFGHWHMDKTIIQDDLFFQCHYKNKPVCLNKP
jgi:hypothetical protein